MNVFSHFSRFFQNPESKDTASKEFSDYILYSMNQLDLKLVISDSEAFSRALTVFEFNAENRYQLFIFSFIDFLKFCTIVLYRQLMSNGLSQLRVYLNVLQHVSSQISCVLMSC